MSRTAEILALEKVGQIPTVDFIQAIPRTKTLKLIFAPSVQQYRQEVGENLQEHLKGFQVGIHTTEPEINIAKLITEEEIIANQDFFEKCAKDYRQLSEHLIYELADSLKVKINPTYPLVTFNPLKRSRKKQVGRLNDWDYFIHGFHCSFENRKTGQQIETPLVFGLEFGDLDPYFFMKFIKSTPQYQPLPIAIYEDYADGVRINEVMVSIGKFERINSNNENQFGIVVKDRDKVEIETYKEHPRIKKQQFNLRRFFKV